MRNPSILLLHDIAELEKEDSFSLPTHDEAILTSNSGRTHAAFHSITSQSSRRRTPSHFEAMRNPPTLSFALHHHGEGLPHVVVHDIAEQEKKESFSLPTHDESMRTSKPPSLRLQFWRTLSALSLARPVVHEGGKPRTRPDIK